jgi:type I restriction enzyme M protein
MPENNHHLQRAELHRTIWNIANDLRGSVDGWDFKQYVLGMLFYRYISENLSAYINAKQHEYGLTDFSYAQLPDETAENARAEMVNTKGFFILPSQLFQNVLAGAPRNPDLNMTLAKVFDAIEASSIGAESEDDFKGLFDDLDVNSNKLGPTVASRNERLVKLMNGVASMQLGNFMDNSIDAFGDAYEYLMSMYAANAGKSGGEFFTPQQVSELLTRLTLVGKTEVNKVYDPACGSGSLLLKFAKILGKQNVRQGFFGQEINLTTYNLCRINMFLHDIGFNKFNIAHGDTLLRPMHASDEPFEAIVSNPPYSIHWEGNANPLLINDPRFSPAGVLAPKSNADFAFILHSLSWLATSGTAAIVCFPGILYRGGAEQKIRKYLIDNNYIDSVIQLPDKLFFGTSIATCIMVLKKSKRDNATLFIDASREFVKVTKNNLLTEAHIERVLTLFENRMDAPYLTRLVPNSEVAEQGYNLSVSSYVEKEDKSEKVDIRKLNAEINRIAQRVNQLRDEIDAIIREIEA